MLIGKLPFKSDMLRELNKVAAEQGVKAGTVQVMGSLRRARLSFYDQTVRAYQELDFDAPHEIVASSGNISIRDDKPFVHLHLAVSGNGGVVVGGHCLQGCSVYAVEFTITPFGGEAPRRVLDNDTGLLLWEKPLYEE